MEKAFGKVLSLLCLALCLTFAVSACGGADPLVGTWTDNNEDGLTITFTQDHTFAISSESGTMLTGTYALDGETLELKCDQASLQAGPWSIEGDVLTLTLDDSVHQYQRQTESPSA
ncbi:MAG: hypothetical protein ACLRP7_07035 [Christensenellales bacterium]|jgi:lipoprotein